MPGEIFYRVRKQSEAGSRQPRLQCLATAETTLQIYGKHLRMHELKFIAEAVGAELLLLPETSARHEEPSLE